MPCYFVFRAMLATIVRQFCFFFYFFFFLFFFFFFVVFFFAHQVEGPSVTQQAGRRVRA